MQKTTVYLPAELKTALRRMARRHRTREVLTLDERHFRALTGPGERPFRILPADL